MVEQGKEVTVGMRKEKFNFWRVGESLTYGVRNTTELKEQNPLFGCGSKTNSVLHTQALSEIFREVKSLLFRRRKKWFIL